MGEVVDLKLASLVDNQELIADLCRFRENLLTEKFIRRKYRLDNATWERLGSDEGNALVEKIEEELVRRIRDGSSKREKSQKLIVKGPDILDSIASDVNASPRHRVDALKTLDGMSGNGPAGVPAADRFQITIVLDADTTLKFDKSIAVDVNDIDPNHIDDTPMIAAIAAKNPTESGGGNAI